jgi:hypothetical protein
MQITVEIVNVSQPIFTKTARGGYHTIEVALKQDGKIGGKKFLDFNDQVIFTQVKGLQVGKVYDVEIEKNDKGFWDWKVISPSDGSVAPAPVAASNATSQAPQAAAAPVSRVTGSNYETPDERSIRRAFEREKHRQIGRQGCLNIALSFQSSVEPKGITSTPEGIIALAKTFENFVFGDAIEHLVSDFPE